jgi:hypothetical protein
MTWHGRFAHESIAMNAASDGRNSSSSSKLRRGLVLLIILLAGMTNLAFPFSGDQALFTLGAQALSRGEILYRDFWDIKQPGIYWFFHLAGALFDYNEIGIHIAELLWFMGLACIISIAMRSRFRISWMGDVTALLTVFAYFAVCGTSHLTQVEGLVSLPLFLALLLSMPDAAKAPPTDRRWIAFGMCAAIVALFKLMLVAIPIAFFAVSIFPDFGKRSLRRGLLAVAGAALLIIPVVVYFGLHHQLPLIYQTFFVYPAEISAGPGMSRISVLRGSLIWFVKAAAFLLPFGFLGALRAVRTPNRFIVAIIVWIFLAIILVLIQRSWWEYHFLMVLFPLGIMAAFGVEDAIGRLGAISRPARNIAAAAMLVLLLSPYAARSIRKAVLECHYPTRRDFDEFESPPYADSVRDSGWLISQPPGHVYVLGNPLIIYLSDHEEKIPLNGWTPERFLPAQWNELVQELNTSRPRYIFVDGVNDDLLVGRGAEFRQLLDKQFTPREAEPDGNWYQRR